ncbi:uncharacterized protein LOC125474717 [Pyrus x bretschneideri]|uniref:uncharacterized protein LOC125474717 n=1 Tax=Pyrus x bretschneideri TaxID=225117 RepID=UPI00202FD499|nr:uncharacterized protein LOC125474717 [Pyrus x bretschneideri]
MSTITIRLGAKERERLRGRRWQRTCWNHLPFFSLVGCCLCSVNSSGVGFKEGQREREKLLKGGEVSMSEKLSSNRGEVILEVRSEEINAAKGSPSKVSEYSAPKQSQVGSPAKTSAESSSGFSKSVPVSSPSPEFSRASPGSSSNEFTKEDDIVEVSSCSEIESDGVHIIETSNETIEEDDVIEATFDATEEESNGVHAVENNGTNMENTRNVEGKVQEPQVGMIFDNMDQVATYYKEYGRQLGFPVIKRSSTKGDDGKLRYITMCCARSGTSKSTSSNPLKPYPSIKNDCKAQLRASLYLGEKW